MKPMDTHCPFGLRPTGPCTSWSFVQLDHLLIGHVHNPPKMNWTGLAHGQPAQLTPLSCGASYVGIVASVLTVGGPHSATDGVGVKVDEKAKLLLTVAP